MLGRIFLFVFIICSSHLTRSMEKENFQKIEIKFNPNQNSIIASLKEFIQGSKSCATTTVTKYFYSLKNSNQVETFFISENKISYEKNSSQSFKVKPSSYTIIKLKKEIKRFEKTQKK